MGGKWVSAWAVTTSDGIILVDAMNNDHDAGGVIEPGMREVGLDPAQIKVLVVTHGHGDHYGGVNYLVRRYSPRVIASAADWRMMETDLEFDIPEWGRPPMRDTVVEEGGTVRLGTSVLDVLITPGHTWGTISLLFDVTHQGQRHRAMLWGGTAFNFGRRPDRLARIDAYIESVARARDIALRQKIDIFISNHSAYDRADAKLARMRTEGGNPFVIGVDKTQRSLTVMHEIAQATKAAWTT